MARGAEPEGAVPSDPAFALSDERLQTLRRGLEIIAVRRLRSASGASDAAQESITRALAARRDGRIPPGVSFEAFVHGIHRHVVTDILRRRSTEPVISDAVDWHAASDPNALESLIASERIEALRAALGRLSAADRGLLRACFFEGRRIVDIASEAGEPPARVRKRKSRALARLRDEVRGAKSLSGHASGGDPTSRGETEGGVESKRLRRRKR